MTRGASLGSRVAAAALVVAAAGLLLAIGKVLYHNYVGDSAIYLSYARNIAHGDFFSFNPHQFSSGSTSPLWAVVMSVPFVFGAGASAAKLWAAALTVAALLASVAVAWRVVGSEVAAAVAAFYAVTTIAIPGLNMYESPLVVALVAGSIWCGHRLVQAADGERLELRALVPLALIWAALPLARPESTVLVPLQMGCLLLARPGSRRRDVRVLLGAAALAALPAALYFGYSTIELGVPSTSSAARSAWLREHADRLGPLYVSSDALHYLVTPPIWYATLPSLGGLALLLRRRRERWLAVYALGGVAVYLLLLTFVTPGFYDTGRYMLPVVPFIVLGGAALLRELERRPALLVAGLALAAAFVIRPAVDVLTEDAQHLRDVPTTLDNTLERGAATTVNRLAAPGTVVLANEVQVRFLLRSDLSVLSLDGITDGKVLPYIGPRDLARFVRRYRPGYWIADTATEPVPPGATPLRLLGSSVLAAAVRRFNADARLRDTQLEGIHFHLVRRRAGPLPYRFGPWTKVFRLSYAAPPA